MESGSWIPTATRYSVFVLILAVVLGGAMAAVRSHDLYDVIRERGPVEIAQLICLTAACVLFWLAFDRTAPRNMRNTVQDMIAVILANLGSFLFGEWWF